MSHRAARRRLCIAAATLPWAISVSVAAETLMYVDRWQWTGEIVNREPAGLPLTAYQRDSSKALFLWLSLQLTPAAVNLLRAGRNLPVLINWRVGGLIRSVSKDVGISQEDYQQASNGIFSWRTYAQIPVALLAKEVAGPLDVTAIAGTNRQLLKDLQAGAMFRPSIQIN